MLDTWDVTIFEGIKQKLEDSAMKLVQDEREGASINSALVIGVRESCGEPSSVFFPFIVNILGKCYSYLFS